MTANLPSQETETRDAGEVRAGFYRVRDALKADDREAMLAIVEEASAKLSKLCHGERWTMTIPVQDTDTDMVLGRAIDLAEKLIERTCKKDLQVPVLDRPSGDEGIK